MGAGIHAYVVNGYGAGRLRGVIRVAQARFAHEAQSAPSSPTSRAASTRESSSTAPRAS